MGGSSSPTVLLIRGGHDRPAAMMFGNGVIAGLGGFAAGGACVWLHAGRVRGELLRMRFAAEHDCLTGLPNRAGIRRRYEHDLSTHGCPTLVLLDLDGFKQVNDTFGHHAGDLFLMGVAARLREACRGIGQVGRLGGDEFLILLPWSTSDEATGAVEVILRGLGEPVAVGEGTALIAKASVGIAMAVAECMWSSQLRCADIALYHAKNGPGGIVLFRDGMRHPNSASAPRSRPGAQQITVVDQA